MKSSIWPRLSRAADRLNEVIGSLIRWLTLAMVLVGAFNALARYLTRFTGLNLSSNAYIDLQWYLFSLLFLLGAAYGLLVDIHVRVDAVYGRLTARARAWIDLAGTLLFLLPFCALMLVVALPAVRNSWIVREVSPDPGGLPRYPIKTVILISFTLLFIQGISQLIKQVALLRGEPDVARTGPTDVVDAGAHHGEGM
jgi:TRAP-type mannitol/chloroaromatic compound transport system permease small subunit